MEHANTRVAKSMDTKTQLHILLSDTAALHNNNWIPRKTKGLLPAGFSPIMGYTKAVKMKGAISWNIESMAVFARK
jgi:hypothetical protein